MGLKTNELQQLAAVLGTDTLLADTSAAGTGRLTLAQLAEFLANGDGAVKAALINKVEKEEWKTSPMGPDFRNAGAHNSLYRGAFLGNAVTDKQYAAISDGTFDDLYIGDYWTIGGVNYRIAAFDYYLLSGDTADNQVTAHHMVIVPDKGLDSKPMNDNNTTDGGYLGSDMYKTYLEPVREVIRQSFSGHILQYRSMEVNAAKNGIPSGNIWIDADIELMNEQMVYGSSIFMAMSHDTTFAYNYRVGKSQLPLFAYRPDLISNRLTYWLKDITSDSYYVNVSSTGMASCNPATNLLSIRPHFCIY